MIMVSINEFRSDLVEDLRTECRNGAGVLAMAALIQDRLGSPRDAVLPVIAYFCHTFELPLVEVLPMQQVWGSIDEEDFAKVLQCMRRRQQQWDDSHNIAPSGNQVASQA